MSIGRLGRLIGQWPRTSLDASQAQLQTQMGNLYASFTGIDRTNEDWLVRAAWLDFHMSSTQVEVQRFDRGEMQETDISG